MTKINYRTQNDDDESNDLIALVEAERINPRDDEPGARQEFRAETDINTIMARFGVNAPIRINTGPPVVDYTIDLQQALHAIHDARRAHRRLTPEMREKYPTWRELLNAIDRGEIMVDELATRPRDSAPLPEAPPPKPPTETPAQ